MHIAKQVTSGAPALGSVSGTIAPGDPAEWTIELTVQDGMEGGHVELDVATAEQTVTETSRGADWLVEYAVVESIFGTCGPAHLSESDWSTDPATIPEGDGDYLVCIRNTYVPESTPTPTPTQTVPTVTATTEPSPTPTEQSATPTGEPTPVATEPAATETMPAEAATPTMVAPGPPATGDGLSARGGISTLQVGLAALTILAAGGGLFVTARRHQ